MGTYGQRFMQRPDLPAGHPLQKVSSELYNADDPLWKQTYGGGELFQPAKIPIALACYDPSEIKIGSLIEPKSESGSESTGESDFWENCVKSGSQSSNEDSFENPPSSSNGEDAKADPKYTSSVKPSKCVSASVKPNTPATSALRGSVHTKKSRKQEQKDPQYDNVTMRCSNAKLYPEKTGFLDLPGEIRNRIYDLVFPRGGDLEITWLTKGKDLTHFRHKAPISKKPRDFIYGRLRPGDADFNGHFQIAIRNKQATIKRRQQARAQTKTNYIAFEEEKKAGIVSSSASDWTLQAKGFAALLGLNRQLHDEAASILYSRTTFSFASRTILDKFLAGLTPVAHANLCKIYLAHDMESPALLKSNRVYKEKERKKWVASLQTLTSKCKALQELHILTSLRGSRFQLDLTDIWAQDLVSGLSNIKSLKHLTAFDIGLIMGDDSSDVRAANSSLPQDHGKIGRATQLDCAADMVRRQLFTTEQIQKMEVAKRKKMKTVMTLRITA